MRREAIISDCGRYRYLLRREWEQQKPRALYVMLNPSTADAEVDDATIRSCIRLAKELGFGSFEVVNLFAWRATDPKELATCKSPFGPGNELAISHAAGRCDVVICAWGSHPLVAADHNLTAGRLRSYKPVIYCLGRTKSGAPKHPLYVKSGTLLEVFR